MVEAGHEAIPLHAMQHGTDVLLPKLLLME